MKKKVFVFLILLIVLFANFISADFEIGDSSHNLENDYASGEVVRGWINMSFDYEDVNSEFKDSFGNVMSLKELLESSLDLDYECLPLSCNSNYDTSSGELEKSFSMSPEEEKLIGFKLSEDIENIDSISFTIESNATSSCENQLKIEIAGETFGNTNALSESCSSTKTKGCFDSSKTTSNYVIGKSPNKHCQKITLPAAPGIELGAWVKPNGDSRDLIMSLYENDWSVVSGGNCEINSPIQEGEVFCSTNFSLTEPKDYYVCIYSADSGTSEVRGYPDSENGCGFYGADKGTEIAAFDIFARGKKFADTGIIQIANTLSQFDTLGNVVGDYLQDVYGNFGCSSGCVVPIKITANSAQSVTINNLTAIYSTELGSTTEETLYDLTETPAKVTADFQKIFLDNGTFYVPEEKDDYTFTLDFENQEILEEKITVGNVPEISKLVYKNAAAAVPIEFEVRVNSSSNITKYSWDFGDNTTEITSSNKIIHTYDSIDTYELTIKVTDKNSQSATKTFEIEVKSPESLANETIFNMKKNLEKINSQIENYDSFVQSRLKEIIDLNNLNTQLTIIESDYDSAYDEEDFIKVMKNLVQLNVPESISLSETANSIPFYAEKENVNIGIVNEVAGGEETKSEYKEAILAWTLENLDMNLDYQEFSAEYERDIVPILSVFDLKITQKNNLDYDYYLFLKNLEGLKSTKNFDEKEDYSYLKLQSADTIVFSTTEKINFEDLPLFVSPSISRLSILKEDAEDKPFAWMWFVLLIILLIIIGFVVYIILQEWYKRKYEDYLFKNKNDLFNIISYVNNMRAKSMQDREIASNLKKSGWGYEQVTYALRKYAGKRTGMVEIPYDRIMNRFKKKEEAPMPIASAPRYPYPGRLPRKFKKYSLEHKKL